MQSLIGVSRGKLPSLFTGQPFFYPFLVKTRIVPISASSLREACQILQGGDLVAFPTETVYGLGALGLRSDAVQKIFHAKGRPSTDPLILHLPSPDLNQAVTHHWMAAPIPPFANELAKKFWPGPLTLVVPKGAKVPLEVTAGLGTVALRVPAHPVAEKLLQELGEPLAAPSANRFGRISPTDASAVLQELDGKIPLILDGGPCPHGIESTVLSLLSDPPTILRPGSITAEMISEITHTEVWLQSKQKDPKSGMPSPGMLENHYAPQTPLYLCTAPIKSFASPYQFILYQNCPTSPEAQVHLLCPDGKHSTAAQNLYRVLREADQAASSAILIDPVPDSPWALALRDRLHRASAGTATWKNGQWNFLPRTHS